MVGDVGQKGGSQRDGAEDPDALSLVVCFAVAVFVGFVAACYLAAVLLFVLFLLFLGLANVSEVDLGLELAFEGPPELWSFFSREKEVSGKKKRTRG